MLRHKTVGWLAFLLSLVQAPLTAGADLSSFRRPDTIPFPAENPYTPEKAALGKALFFEPRLSGAENMNCASCHNPSFGWEVSTKTPLGAQNTHLARHAPTILNTAWTHPFFWDGRAASAEEQAAGPLQASDEMNMAMPLAIQRLEAIPGYAGWFRAVFPGQSVTSGNILKAIATFERTIVASYAPFDRWVDGDQTALSDEAKQGFEVFIGKGQCVACHSGWNFSDNEFHDIGLPGDDRGRGKLEPDNPVMQYAFKTPTLRDIAQRAPYMHNGEFDSLESVVAHYAEGGVDRPSRSPQISLITLSEKDRTALVAFLKSLTGERPSIPLPILPN